MTDQSKNILMAIAKHNPGEGIFIMSIDPAQTYDEMTRLGFKLDLITGYYVKEKKEKEG